MIPNANLTFDGQWICRLMCVHVEVESESRKVRARWSKIISDRLEFYDYYRPSLNNQRATIVRNKVSHFVNCFNRFCFLFAVFPFFSFLGRRFGKPKINLNILCDRIWSQFASGFNLSMTLGYLVMHSK